MTTDIKTVGDLADVLKKLPQDKDLIVVAEGPIPYGIRGIGEWDAAVSISLARKAPVGLNQ